MDTKATDPMRAPVFDAAVYAAEVAGREFIRLASIPRAIAISERNDQTQTQMISCMERLYADVAFHGDSLVIVASARNSRAKLLVDPDAPLPVIGE